MRYSADMTQRKLLLIFSSILFLRASEAGARTKTPAVCDVKIVKTLQALIMPGMPHLEELIATTENHMTGDIDIIQLHAHSGHHLSCRYQVEVNGKSYLYYDESDASKDQNAEKECRAKYDEIREKIASVTKSCKNLEAPDRYGTTLHPFFP
jgi:hypothetical protein